MNSHCVLLRTSGRAACEYGSVRRESLRSLPRPALAAPFRVPGAGSASAPLGSPNRGYECAQGMVVPNHPERATRRSHHPKSPECALGRELFVAQQRPTQRADQDLSHEPRQARATVATRPDEATSRCRVVTSPERCQRELPFPHRFRCEAERFWNVLSLQIRIQCDDLVRAHAFGDELQHHRYRNAQSANTRSAAHLIGTDRDAREGHAARIASLYEASGSAPRLNSTVTASSAKAFPSSQSGLRSDGRQVALATPQDYKVVVATTAAPLKLVLWSRKLLFLQQIPPWRHLFWERSMSQANEAAKRLQASRCKRFVGALWEFRALEAPRQARAQKSGEPAKVAVHVQAVGSAVPQGPIRVPAREG
jgi:hypothetical protein